MPNENQPRYTQRDLYKTIIQLFPDYGATRLAIIKGLLQNIHRETTKLAHLKIINRCIKEIYDENPSAKDCSMDDIFQKS